MDMYAVFNTLNEDRQYDVHCNMERKSITSRLKVQVCKPQFESGITISQFDGSGDAINIDNSIRLPGSEIRKHQKILKEKMLRMAEESPELADAVYRRAALEMEYERSKRRSRE